MATTFGENTIAIVYKKEMHKLHEAFEVADGETIHEGELVELNSDGEIIKLDLTTTPAATAGIRCIGYCTTIKKAGENSPVSVAEELSIAMKGYATVLASAGEDSLVPGPVKAMAYDTTNNRPKFSGASVDEKNMVGWALIGGNEDDEIRVVLK